MPIYAYKCNACGHEQDVLQKMSDPVLTVCPECGQSTYAKQVTAAGFQLKGSGGYVTDFRNNVSSGKSSGSAAPKESASTGGGDTAKAATAAPASGSGTTPSTSA